MVNILCEIYEKKRGEDVVVLDGAHSHVAHLCVKEAIGEIKDANELFVQNGIHCDRSVGCDVSGGSLGHGLGISIGMAIANKDRVIHCILTDGSVMEGSDWEALRIKSDLVLPNLKIYCNFNSYTATSVINREKLAWQVRGFCPDAIVFNTNNQLQELTGVKGHYVVL